MVDRKRYAVVMGDLVRSSEAHDRRELHRRFNRRVDDANERFADTVASPLTITLGDEFQGIAHGLESAFSIGHFVRVSLLQDGLAARIAVGEVTLETDLNPEKAWNMMGPGLAEARDRLADKKDENCYRFSMLHERMLERLLDGVGRSLTKIEEAWTETQLEYVAAILSEPQRSRSETAEALGVSENSLYKVLRAADYRFYTEQIETIHGALSTLDREHGSGGE